MLLTDKQAATLGNSVVAFVRNGCNPRLGADADHEIETARQRRLAAKGFHLTACGCMARALSRGVSTARKSRVMYDGYPLAAGERYAWASYRVVCGYTGVSTVVVRAVRVAAL